MTTTVQVPEWLQIVILLGPLITTGVIGLIGILIAYRQWRTAQEKVHLDLFDRRFQLLMDLFSTQGWFAIDNPVARAKQRDELYAKVHLLMGPRASFLVEVLLRDVNVDPADVTNRNEWDKLISLFSESLQMPLPRKKRLPFDLALQTAMRRRRVP